tara:strand:+ start:1096 stop:1416 length:321 start_codon:yes stop_codon:yes gene_type:complete
MVRPGMKRLRQAHSVKVQPNKTGTSLMQGHSVIVTKGMVDKKGVVFSSAADTPYNNLSNNKIWAPNPADILKAKKDDRCYNQIKQKEYLRDINGDIIAKSWNFSWQ